jgi:hypothetical protein
VTESAEPLLSALKVLLRQTKTLPMDLIDACERHQGPLSRLKVSVSVKENARIHKDLSSKIADFLKKTNKVEAFL